MTNLVSAFSDQRALQLWLERMTLLGLLADDGVIFDEMAATPDSELTAAMIEEFAEKARMSAGATGGRHGTARHRLLEHYLDTGQIGGHRRMRLQMEQLLVELDRHDLELISGSQERVVWHPIAGGTMGRMDARVLCRRTGEVGVLDLKGLALDTPIPTPSGWTTMGAVQVGDIVFDAYGAQTTVIAKSEIKRIGTYVVRFDDGSEIVCDREHIWWTRKTKSTMPPRARAIGLIEATIRYANGSAAHAVPNADALDLPEIDLPVEPYLLGAWLGNGDRSQGVITSMRDLFDQIELAGHRLGKEYVDTRGNKAVGHTVLGLRAALRRAEMLGHKTVPDVYLRAGTRQRIALLQGLMDTDGTWNKPRRSAVFSSVSKSLALQVVELLSTLGQRAHLAEFQTHGFGKDITAYAVEFTPIGVAPFRLDRKASQCSVSTKNTTRASRRLIVSIEPGPDVETACIAVSSESSTYLAGERMIPTHNTQRRFWTYQEIAGQQCGYDSAAWIWEGPESRQGRWVMNETGTLMGREGGMCEGKRVAILAHMPSDGGKVQLHEVDLEYGAQVLEVAAWVVALRSRGKSVKPGRGVGGLRPLHSSAIVEA